MILRPSQRSRNALELEKLALVATPAIIDKGFDDYLDLCATPDDRARFGNELISRGGVLASIGRSIKIQAILQGPRSIVSRPASPDSGRAPR